MILAGFSKAEGEKEGDAFQLLSTENTSVDHYSSR